MLGKVVTAIFKSEQFLVAKSGCDLCMTYLTGKDSVQSFM